MTRTLLLTVTFCSALSMAQTESPPPMVPAPTLTANPTQNRVQRKRPRLGLVIGGAATFVVSYGLTAGTSFVAGGLAGLSGSAGAKTFLGMVPVVGPLFLTSEWGLPLTLASTALQVGGLLMLGAGFLFPSTTWVTRGGNQVTLEFGPTGVRGRF